MYQLVSILRQASYMVSSRYHGIVTCMPSLVASAGVTMDERIRNLMRERGQNHLCITVDDPDLGPKMLQMMETLVAESDSIRQGIGDTVVRNLKVMARMGVIFEDLMRRQYPEFPLRGGVRSWEEYLPPLSENLVRLAETYDVSEAAMAVSK
jgi:polysaccharide pyruvyl transferase WcaK-like protein